MTDTRRTLEGYRFFPYIAWVTIILFTIFVYNLAVELRFAAEHLQSTTTQLETLSKTAPEHITDFTPTE
jgi:hypothetical protein